MPLPHAKKQKTLGCVREIQVCKLRTKAYSQKRLPAMLYTCVCIAECVTSVASFLVNATGIVVMFAVLIVGNPATIITFLRHHCKLYVLQLALQAGASRFLPLPLLVLLSLSQSLDPCSCYISFNHRDKYQSLIWTILWACCMQNPKIV